ncbi:unnamed protein product [Heterobilharzia americana]|nr:unnamed protein product [Heterobilharzia americana]
MKTLKDYIQDVKSRFKLVAVIAVLTVILGIWYIGVFSLDEIGQFISIYQNVATWNLKKEHIYYSNFEIFKKNVINGSHELNKTKVHYIVIYGEMLASINKDVKVAIQWVNADLILIPNKIFPPGKRPKHQAWVAYDYESPLHSRLSTELNDKINFTATYRFDSTIRTPYGMYTPNSPEDNNNDNRSQSNKMKK